MEFVGEYTKCDLALLHKELHNILGVVIECCDRLAIEYVIIGGSAIGAHFEGDILPWDDDVDLGMEREAYDRFIREVGSVLPEGYTLQSPETEPDTPYYFAKIRRDGTLFVGEDEAELDIHHGIYIDIFPLDRTPDNHFMEMMQRKAVRFLTNAFVGSTIELKGGAIAKAGYKVFTSIVPKRLIYRLLKVAQGLFNSHDTEYVNIVNMPKDHIARKTLHPSQNVKFGDRYVKAPHDLERYLKWHYKNLRKVIPVEEQVNHAPQRLRFRM